MRSPDDLKRELQKILDAMRFANEHFEHEAFMNAALHCSRDVRATPLASKMAIASADLERLIAECEKDMNHLGLQ